jgi:DNA invertase Pin-like site-specific DNA recombinase
MKFKPLTEAIDTETPTGRAMWQMIGVLAELERSLITERTRAGVKAAQRRGVKFGRKAKLTPDRLAHARKLIDQGKSPTEAAKIIGIARATIYRRCSGRRREDRPKQPAKRSKQDRLTIAAAIPDGPPSSEKEDAGDGHFPDNRHRHARRFPDPRP